MNRTFRLRKGYLLLGLWTGVLFTGMFFAAVIGSFLDAPHPTPMLAMALFWTGWMSLSGYLLLAYFNALLKLNGKTLTRRGVLRSQEILFDQSASIKWRIWPQGGSIVVRSPRGRIAFDLNDYEPSERVAIISCVHNALPPNQQTGWEAFCQRWALPLVEPVDETKTVLLTRRQIDRLFAWMLVPTAALTGLLIYLDGWKWWPSLLVLVPFWVVLRTVVGRSGTRSSSTAALPGFGWWLASFVGLVGGTLLYGWMKPVGVTVWMVAAACFVQFMHCASAEERRQREQREASKQTADERWRDVIRD